MNNKSAGIWIALLMALGVTTHCDLVTKPSTGESNFGTRQFGSIVSKNHILENGKKTACEHPWTIRINIYHPTPRVPRRSYFHSCENPDGSSAYYHSLTVNAQGSENGAIIEYRYDHKTDEFGEATEIQFNECKEMHGIAGSATCGENLAAMCRRENASSLKSVFKKDMVAAIENEQIRDWLTQIDNSEELANSGSGKEARQNDEIWLYEWPQGDVGNGTADKYIAHKGIGSWEYGNNYLIYGATDNTYGVAPKATVFDPNGGPHEADAFLIVNRGDFSIDTSRAWYWACAHGHTIFNRPAYNTETGLYAMLCTTDGNDSGEANSASMNFRLENGPYNDFNRGYLEGLVQKGGNGALQPLPGGGYLGVIVGLTELQSSMENGFRGGETTGIGLVEFDSAGQVVGDIRWVARAENIFYSYPQLVPLGDGSFLLGYAGMLDRTGITDLTELESGYRDEFLRIASNYYLMEVDKLGNPITQPQRVDAYWGEQDQMIPIGYGKVAWSYVSEAIIKDDDSWDGAYPDCAQNTVASHVYVSTIAND